MSLYELAHEAAMRGFYILALLLGAYLLAVAGNALWEHFNHPRQ